MPADRGNITVCIYRDLYRNKAEQLLSDTSTYKILVSTEASLY